MTNLKVRAFITGLIGVIALGAIWELYKFLAPDTGVMIGSVTVLPRTSDLAMPHLWDMVTRLGDPVNRARDAVPMWMAVAQAGLVTLRIAAIGWGFGLVVGLVLAIAMQAVRTIRAAILPWVVISQTVPLIALAPLIKGWGTQLQFGEFVWEPWMSVAVIASYLAFFPITIGALRGLNSPEKVHVDLMRAYGLGWWSTLWRLRFPASVPHLIPAMRLGAAGAVIGAIVAEVSIGMKGGLGRMIIEFAQAGSSDPPKAWAPIFGAILVGLISAGVVTLIGVFLRRYRFAEVS